jgi:hypothetical protein
MSGGNRQNRMSRICWACRSVRNYPDRKPINYRDHSHERRFWSGCAQPSFFLGGTGMERSCRDPRPMSSSNFRTWLGPGVAVRSVERCVHSPQPWPTWLHPGSFLMRRKRTAAEKRARRERKQKYMTIFIHGKQKRVLRPQTIDGIPVEEFIARNADPIWLQENELWEYMNPDEHFPDRAD